MSVTVPAGASPAGCRRRTSETHGGMEIKMAREPYKAGEQPDGSWRPAREWDPPRGITVVDFRRDTEGRRGELLASTGYGHFADPYWRATVRWDNGFVEHNINTVWLTREDGTQ